MTLVELEATCRNHNDRTDTIQVPRDHWYEYVKGAFVQDVFPYLTPQGREVIISQRMPYAYLCEECWDQLGEAEEDMDSIPCPACGTMPPDDYCADCDIVVSHDACDDCEEE